MNFKQMYDRVKYTLGAEETIANDEVALIKEFLNEGVVQILVRTRPYTRCIKLQLTADTAIHDMSGQILALLDLEDSIHGFLRRLSREDAVKAQKSGAPGFAYEEPLLWVSPIPSEAVEVGAYGVFRPTAMTGDTNDPTSQTYGGLAPEFHPAIVMYALWKMGEYVQHEGSGEGERWRVQYEGQDGTEGEIARIKRILSKRVTPQAAARRDLASNLPSLSPSGSYLSARG